MEPTINSQLQLAHEFVHHTGRNVFLSGKAGTGKTTFLHRLKESTDKRMVVVAPTGVAAINAGGGNNTFIFSTILWSSDT